MLTNKLYSFRSYFRSSTKRYLHLLKDIEAAKDTYVAALEKMCEACEYNIGSTDQNDDEWLKNFLPVAVEELHSLILAPANILHADFKDYHENADRFRIVVFGKVNSGKSYLANLLIGRGIAGLKQEALSFHAVTSDGTQVRLDEFEVKPTEATKEIQWCDVETLRVVDLPGIGSISPRNHDLAVSYVKKADLVLFLSNSDAVLRGSEFKNIRDDLYGEKKRMLFVITQCDMVRDIDTDERIPMKKRDINDMVRYVETSLRNPKYGVSDLMKSLDIVPVSARLARVGLEMELHGDRKHGVEKQRESNIQTLVDKILRIIAEEGRELRILNPLNHVANVLDESMADIRSLQATLSGVSLFSREVTHRIQKLHTELNTSAKTEREALTNFIEHRRVRVELALDEIFSDVGVRRTLRDQHAAAEMMTKKFEEDVRSELRTRLLNGLHRWKDDAEREYSRFLEDCRTFAGRITDGREADPQRTELRRDFREVITNLITRRMMKVIERQFVSALQEYTPENTVTTVSLEYSQPISGLIIHGMLSNFGIKFHLKKEKVRKSVRATIFRGLQLTEEKALALYDAQTRTLNETLETSARRFLIEHLRAIVENLSRSAHETLKTGRTARTALEAIRKREIAPD